MRRCLASAAVALSLVGCSDDDESAVVIAVPTEVAVAPQDFLGSTPCGSFEGAARAFVATLLVYDDAEDDAAVTVSSSYPVPCSSSVGFREVIVVGKRYAAQIDVYGIPAGELSPFGDASSGSRQMLRDGEPVAPRWTTSCGGTSEMAPEARLNNRVYLRPCEPLAGEARGGALAISAVDVLGDDPCSVAPSVALRFETGGLPDVTLACDAEPAVFDVVAGTEYRAYATATVEGAILGTICSAGAVGGLTVRPSCAGLSAVGSVTVSLSDVGGEAPVCPAGAHYDLYLGEEVLNTVPLSCSTTANLGPFDPGSYSFEAFVYDELGGLLDSGASCTAEIEPGRIQPATCVAR